MVLVTFKCEPATEALPLPLSPTIDSEPTNDLENLSIEMHTNQTKEATKKQCP